MAIPKNGRRLKRLWIQLGMDQPGNRQHWGREIIVQNQVVSLRPLGPHDWVQCSNTIEAAGKSLEACRTTFLQGGMPSDFTSLLNPLVPWVDYLTSLSGGTPTSVLGLLAPGQRAGGGLHSRRPQCPHPRLSWGPSTAQDISILSVS